MKKQGRGAQVGWKPPVDKKKTTFPITPWHKY